MSDSNAHHTPSPEFRASLERELMQAFRRQSMFEAPPSMTRRARLRTAVTLLIGLTIGVGSAVATAQVQSTRIRDSVALAADSKRQLAMLRLQLAEANYQSIKKATLLGARSQDDLPKALLDLLTAQSAVERVDFDIAEIKESGLAARDELWAPSVNTHDYVWSRLRLDAYLAGQRLSMAQQEMERNRRRGDVAFIDADSVLLRQDVSLAELDLQLLQQRIALRLPFQSNKVDEKSLPLLLEVASVQHDVMRASLLLKAAQIRAKRARDLYKIGSATELDAKRAEVEVLEVSLEMSRLNEQLKLLQAQTKKKDN